MRTTKEILQSLFPELPEQLLADFNRSILYLNLTRIRVMAWVMIPALVVYTTTDYLHFSALDTPHGWETLTNILLLRSTITIFTIALLVLLGPPFPMENLKPRHRHLDIIFSYVYLIYVTVIMAFMYDYRPDLSIFLFFILVASGFLSFPPLKNLFLLLSAFLSMAVSLPLFGNRWEDYKYHLITAGLMVMLSYALSRLMFVTRIRDFMSQKLIQRQNAELDKARRSADD
ncbi:MAG: hypothetical protein KKB70_07695, partial [Proteobacteria bacterium]|nr:hypothetical protein [Pseudomonadota bacterium]